MSNNRIFIKLYRSFYRSLFPVTLFVLAFFVYSQYNLTAKPAEASGSLSYQFSTDGRLYEASTMSESSSPYWWLNSGAYLDISGGVGKTVQGSLPSADKYRLEYFSSDTVSTDNGYHPQNIFSLYTRQKWGSSDQQVYVKINAVNLSNTANRYPWNAVSLVSRKQDNGDFYYVELRMDGYGAVKKRAAGINYTLSSLKLFPGTYSSTTNPNLIPKSTLIGIRQKTTTLSNGTVQVQLFADTAGNGSWKLVAEANDNGSKGRIISAQGYSGLLSDFMDLQIDNFKINDIAVTSTPTPSATVSATPSPTPSITPTPSTSASVLFSDPFSQYSNGLITNEYAFWNPTAPDAKHSSKWELTSGSLFAKDGAGWTGVPNAGAPGPLSSAYNNSSIFRLTTKQANFGNVAVTFDLLNQGLTSNSVTPAVDWDGVHVFLRYQSEEYLYYASINRRDNSIVIKKKVPGGPSNGGTYTSVGTYMSHAVPYNTWQKVKATIKNNSDGSVTIQLYADGKLLISAIDNGVGGVAPIRISGKVGIRGDNANLKFKNFTVTAF
jgi:hypothetical protein